MQSRRGSWMGFLVSGLFLGLIGLAVCGAATDSPLISRGFSKVCHQFGDRCHTQDGVALPVCVRCLWIYGGLALGHLLFIFYQPEPNNMTRTLIGAIALMLGDVLCELLGFYHNLFWTRAVTGFLFGLAVSHFTLSGLREIYCELSTPLNHVRIRFLTGKSR